MPASRLDFLLFLFENSHCHLDISISSCFGAARPRSDWMDFEINSVFNFLTHAHSQKGKVSCILGGKNNLEPKKQAYP